MSTGSKVALGIIGALAAGVVVGLLIAPEKGADLRKRLKKNVGTWSDQLSHLFSQAEDGIKTEAKEKVSRAREAMG
jgi:gas vesicle protein